jgi:hypothetical protein
MSVELNHTIVRVRDITVTPTVGPFFWGAGNRAGALR